jgi:hypothetical protein
MAKPVPFDDPQVNALLARISQQAARTVARNRAARGVDALNPGASSPVRYGRRRTDRPLAPGEQERLSDQAIRLLQALPAEMHLVVLRGEYPRIVNGIAARWQEPLELQRYFDSLLIDSRGGRVGFPFRVLAELSELRAYHLRLMSGRPPGL